MSVPAYPSYRDSRVEWLREVPSHWPILPGRRIFKQTRLPALPDDEQLSSTQRYGVIPQALFMAMEDQKVVLALSGTDAFKHVDKDDFVISLRSFQGGIERCRFKGCVSPAYTVLKPSEGVVPGYWEHLLKCSPYIAALQSVTDGIREGKTVRYEQFGTIPAPLPPPSEQASIAAFLDRETAKIDALVEEQRRLVELLKEKRQAVISHAVTKGLDPTVPMKDSGVEWLGAVPAHWEVERLKRVSPEITVGIVVEPSKYYAPEGVPALRSLNVRPGRIDENNLVFISEEANELLSKSKLRAGDLVSVRTGQPGTTAVVPAQLDGCNCIDLIVIRKPLSGSEKFLCWYFASDAAVHQFSEGSGGAIQQHFNIGTAMQLLVSLPPAEEQARIASYLDQHASAFDDLTSEAQAAVALLQERRAALISAAVTGKIDVRGLVPAEAEAA